MADALEHELVQPNLDQVNDGVGEKDQVHVGAPDDVIVLIQEVLESLLQTLERLDRFINLGQLHVSVFDLFTRWLRSISHKVHKVPEDRVHLN